MDGSRYPSKQQSVDTTESSQPRSARSAFGVPVPEQTVVEASAPRATLQYSSPRPRVWPHSCVGIEMTLFSRPRSISACESGVTLIAPQIVATPSDSPSIGSHGLSRIKPPTS
jgi:hypothetical protein